MVGGGGGVVGFVGVGVGGGVYLGGGGKNIVIHYPIFLLVLLLHGNYNDIKVLHVWLQKAGEA